MAYTGLLWSLVLRDLKLKYKGSLIGFFWSLLNPIVMLVVYTWVFGTIMHSGVAHFPIFLMVGLLPWNFLASCLTVSVGSFTSNAGLITKVNIPTYIFVLSSLVFNLVIFLMMLVIIVISMPVFGVAYTPDMWYLPIALGLQLLFSIGLGLLLSTVNVFFHDTAHLIEIGLMAWFWLTPVIYQTALIPKGFRYYVSLNPMSFIIDIYRKAFLGDRVYSSPVAALLTIGLVFVAGLVVYRRYGRKVAEWL